MSVPTVHVLTEANQREMQQQLAQLAQSHKKAKLQELFERQDELRPFTSNHPRTTPKGGNVSPRDQSDEEIEAMKSRFNALHHKQLHKQIKKQFLLRVTSSEDVYQTEDAEDTAGYDGGSDGSGEVKVDEKDVAAMKEDFNKQQKSLLKTQIERSFNLRTPRNDDDIDDETEEQLMEDSEEMKTKYKELNKVMVRLRSMKTLEMGINPQIKPKHKEQFHLLLQDIGIVNECIMEQLWNNIEETVDDEVVDPEQEEDDGDEEDRKDKLIAQLQKDNELLRQQIQMMQQQDEMQALPVDSEDDEMFILN